MKKMLNWLDNVIKLDKPDKDTDQTNRPGRPEGPEASEERPERPGDLGENPEREPIGVSTDEILDTVQSFLNFLGSMFDFLTETKKN